MEDLEMILRQLIKSVVREVADEIIREHRLQESKASQRTTESEDRLLLTTSEAAKRLAISDRHLFKLTSEGVIPCVKVGQSKRYSVKAIENWIRESESTAQSRNATSEIPVKAMGKTPVTTRKPRRTSLPGDSKKTEQGNNKLPQKKEGPSRNTASVEDRSSPFRLMLDEIGVDRNEFSEITNGELRHIAEVDIATMHGWLYLGKTLPDEALEKLRNHFIAHRPTRS